MSPFPPETHCDLPGWELSWFRLLPTSRGDGELRQLSARVVASVQAAFADRAPSEDEVVQAVRRLFRAAGCDPTRHRPSSEALIRRVLKQESLPSIHPLVDLNNLLSLRLRVPCCVLDPRAVDPPFSLRAGSSGESMESLRGAFNLEGKPVMVDANGAFGTPITDSVRVKITTDSNVGWLVAYGVTGLCEKEEVARDLKELLREAPVAELSA